MSVLWLPWRMRHTPVEVFELDGQAFHRCTPRATSDGMSGRSRWPPQIKDALDLRPTVSGRVV